MSEWFKKNIRDLGNAYRNSDNAVRPKPKEPGILDRLGDAASDVGDWIGSHMTSVENNPMYDDYTKLADHVLTDDRSLAADNNTTLGAFSNAAVHGAAGTGAGLARMFHADTLADRLNAVAKNVEDTEAIDPSFSLEYILNPHGLARSTGEVAGSVASIAPAAMFVPEGVVGAGTGLVGRMGANRALQWLIDRGYYTAANRIASTIPGSIQYGLGSALTESLAEGGGSREEALNAGLGEGEATKRSIETAALNLPLLMASNTVEAGLLRGLMNIPARAGAGAVERVATAPFRAVPGAIANGLQQGTEEFYQEGIQAGVSGREYGLTPFTGSDEQYKAAAEGFAGSLLPGLAGGTVSGLGRRRREERSNRSISDMQERLEEIQRNRGIVNQLNGEWQNREDSASEQGDLASLGDEMRRIQAEIDNIGNGQAPSANASGQGTREDTSGNQGLRQFIISDEVSNPTLDELTNRKALLLNNDYYNKYGRDLFVTSMKRNGNPDGSSSYHDSGQAFDTADDLLESNAEARKWLIEQGKKYGLYALDEYEDPSPNATGGHVHFSDHGEEISGSYDRGTSESSRNADDFSDLHTKNPDPARIWDFLRASGYSEEATAGIMGRMKQERGDFSATMEPFQMLDGIGEVGGMGMFQWTYDRGEGDTPNPDSRLAYYLQWCEENNLEPEDALNQLTYMRDVDLKDQRTTLYTGHTFDPDEMNALDRHGAADLWTRHYERGQAGNEHDYADEIFNQYSGRKVGAPSPGVSRNTGKTTNAAGTSTTQRQEKIEIPNESSKLYEEFAREQMKDSQSYNWADFVDFFKDGKPDGEFLGTKENLARIKELAEGAHAKAFDDFMKRNAPQEEAPEVKPPKAKTAPETPKIETKADRLASLRDKLEAKKEEAIKAQDFPTVSNINKALRTEDIDSMISLAGVPKNYLEAPAPVETNTATSENGSNQGQVKSAQNQTVQAKTTEARDSDIRKKAYEYGMSPVAETKQEREKQGKGLIITASTAELSLPDKLKRGLRNGSADAIREAQEIVRKEIPAPAFDGAVPISRSAIEAIDRAGGTANENTESTKAAPEKGTGNAENQNQDTESGQGEKGEVAPGFKEDVAEPNQGKTLDRETVTEAAPNTKQGEKTPKALSTFRKNASALVDRYRAGEISYKDAHTQLVGKILQDASRGARDEATRNALVDEVSGYVSQIEEISQGQPATNEAQGKSAQTEENLSLSQVDRRLRELKKQRKQDIADEVERMERNPGGKGVEVGYTYNDRGEINGRYGVSNNPEWYQRAYKKYGRKPKKGEYADIAEDSLKAIQEFDERDREIARLEGLRRQMKENASRSGQEKSAQSEAVAENTTTQNEAQENPEEKAKPEAENKKTNAEEKTSEPKQETGKEHKYYMNERPVSPGAQPKGFTRFDEDDKGGRYGAIYYDHPLTEQEIKDYELTPAEESSKDPFGDKETNIKEMLEGLGITEEAEETVEFTDEFGDTTDEEIEAIKAKIHKKMNRISANALLDPELYVLYLQLGGKYIQKGYRTFKKWMGKMTSDFGEEAEPWATAVWETLKTYPKGQKFEPKQVMLVTRVVGNLYGEGTTSLDDVQAEMKKLLKGKHKQFAPMVEASYNGVKKFYDTIREGENNADDSTRGLASRTGEGNNQDAVGADDESGRPRSGSVGEGVQEASDDIQRQGGSGVRDSSASSGRASGHRGVQAEESEDRADSAGSAELSGSVRAGYEGSLALDDGRQAEDIVSSEERRDHAGDEEKVKKDVPYQAGSLDSIKHDLPMLLPEQQEDVEFIEKRLLVNNGTGALLTNGTGTGKTYSGLGMVKRFYDSGKKNILIVVPSEEVAKQWSESAGKDFGIDVKPLAGVTDNGESGVCVTTYANFQQNKELATRDWDAVVADEAHNLMQNEQGKPTGYLDMLRVLTLHPKEFYKRWQLQNRTKKIRSLEEKIDDAKKSIQKADRALNDGKIDSAEFARRNKKAEEAIKQNETLIYDEYQKMNDKWKEVKKELEAMDPKDRPKVLFLSATPFAYDKDVDYAEGYLFDYDKAEGGRYNQATGRDKFMVENFGYRMRYNKLTKPETQVDNRVMEVQFHDRLVNSGAMRGRMIDIDVDYDRGFLLVDGGIGTKIDEGFRFLRDSKKYNDLYEALNKQFDRRAKRYLLESIKAKAAIPIVREYIQSGKKVVLFHQAMQDKMNVHPFQLKGARGRTQEETDKVRAQWAAFQQERPDLVQLKLSDIPSPMETFKAAFGEDALYIDGSAEHKKGRDSAQNLFNDDDSGKNLIICQQDAANAGISLHDTTGKHQRVLINIAMPERPIYAMQIEGRIYRIGSKTNAVFRYLATGTDMEKTIFADTIGGRAETAENLAQGQDARGLYDSFTNLYMETMDGSWERRKPGHKEEGTGGKDMDFSGKEDVSDWQRAKAFYYGQQKKTGKTKAQEGKDYFATPEPVGLKMVQWLGLKDGDSVLEPSAGHGAISRWFSPNTSNTIVEPSGKLSPIAQMVTPNAKAVNSTFEDFNIVNKFDGVVMNPPFGSGGKTAVDHIAKAYRHLKDGGRMVAILPEGSAADAQFNKWFYGENKKGEQVQEPPKGAMLAAQIHLPSVTFGRAGTGVATRIVVIDKQMDKAQADKAYASFGYGRETDLRDIKDINELFDRMENMTVPERVKTSEDDSKGESSTEYSLRDSYQADVGGNKVTVRSDGSITGDTYTARKTIKKYGAKWDKDNKAWVIHDKDELVRFINNYNTDGVTIEKSSSNRKYSIDNSDNKRYSISSITGEQKDELFRQVSKHLDSYVDEQVANGKNRTELLDELASEHSSHREKLLGGYRATARDFEARKGDKEHRQTVVEAHWPEAKTWTENREAKIKEAYDLFAAQLKEVVDYAGVLYREIVIDRARASRNPEGGIQLHSWRDAERQRAKREAGNHQNSIRPTSRSEESGFSNARSMDEIKDEAKAAFPNAKVEDKGDTLAMTMPNGQKVTVALHESIEVSDEELSMAKSAHGFDKGASVTIEGYAETVNGDGFIALSQGSRKGTGFHEAYHIAEAMAFTKKELADAKRLISDNEEKRADAYAKWKLSRQKHSNFAKLWQKIADVAAKMAGILGYETKRNLFRKVASGEIYERDNAGAKDAEKKFSLDNSDNSRESWFQKVKNLVGYVEGAKGKELFRRKMTDMLSEACGVKIRYGHKNTANGVTVEYNEKKKTIRSAHAYDWKNILPVASDLIAERLGVQKSEPMRNYIANWVLDGAPNNTSKEADEFHEAMQRNPHYADRLLNLRFTFQEWADKSAEERMDASVQWAKPSDVSWKDRKNDLYDQFIESLGPVERLVKEAKKNGVEIADAVNPAIAFRLFRGNYGRAITMIEGRGEAALHGLQMNFPGVDFTGFKTLHDIMKGIGALQNIERQKDFVRYCMCKHILDMHQRNRDMERYIDALDVRKDEIAEEIENLKKEKDELKGKLSLYQSEVNRLEQIDKAIKKNRDELAQCDKEIKQWQEKHMAIPDAYSEEECKKVIEKWKGEFDEAQRQIVTFSDVTAQILYKGGVISYDRLKTMRKTWPNYVPLFRVFEENDEIDFGDSLKTLSGSERDIINPLESIVKNTVEFIKRAEKNKAKVLLADLAMCEGTGSLLDIVDDAKPNDKTTIIYYENGKKKYLQTDPSVVNAINAMDRRNSNTALRFMHAVMAFGRAMYTIFSPEFAERNIFRDYEDAFVYGKNGVISPKDWVRGALSAIHRDKTYYEWLSSGAAIASAVSLDRDYTQEMLDKLGRSMLTRAKSGPKGFAFTALEALQKIGEYSEYATRIARYEKTKKQLIKEKRMEAREALISAAFESRDLMDFSRRGEAGEFWNKLVPFANASLQGMDKFYREVLDPEAWRTNRKKMVWTVARMALIGILPSLLLSMLYGDDDWYKEEPKWLKETHWTLKLAEDVLLRIPKGNDIGVRFFSNLVDKALDKEPHKLKEYAMPFWDMLPDFLPLVFRPIIEANLNKSFFTGKSIVPSYQEKNLPEKLQYGPYTTGLSKYLGEKLNIAPSKVDHVIAGYGGSLGMFPFRLVDILAGDRQLDTSITEMPLTRALTYMPYKNPRSVTRYYDELDKQKKLQNEYKMTHEKPDDFDPAYLKRLESIDKEMKKLSKRERDAINNKSYGINQRKSIQNEIQKRRISLVDRVLK